MIIRLPKSEAASVARLYHHLYEQENAPVELVELYEELDGEFEDLQADMQSVEEQVEMEEGEREAAEEKEKEARDEVDYLTKGVKSILASFGSLTRKQLKEELERLLP